MQNVSRLNPAECTTEHKTELTRVPAGKDDSLDEGNG